MSSTQLLRSLATLKEKRAALSTKLSTVNDQLTSAVSLYSTASDEVELLTKCSTFLSSLAMSLQETTLIKIEEILTAVYQFAFETSDSIVIQLDLKRKVPVASFLIKTKKGGKDVLLNPENQEGGGKVEVIALGLRVAGLILLAPQQDRVLILDEPFRQLSSKSTSQSLNKQRAVQLLKSISEKYKIQMIIISHDAEFTQIADTVYNVALNKDGYATTTRQK